MSDRLKHIGFLFVLVLLYPLSVLAWTPPIGVPVPPWPSDLDMARPNLPNPWTSEVAGFYYIDPTGCSDTGRTYGRLGAPRCSWPSSVPSAGSVVVLNGTINANKLLSYSGTSENPIWIMGYDTGNKPTITGYLELLSTSNYVILDSLNWNFNTSGGNKLSGNYIMVRNCNLENTYDTSPGAGFGINGKYIIYYNNTVSKMGNWQYSGTSDIDRLGIKVLKLAQDVWIVDSIFYHCQSDGAQIGDATNTPSEINRVYVGRNIAYENYQFGFWTKNATDVIFSQNVVYNHKTNSVSGPGGGLGGQYDPKYIWFLFNKLYNNNTGIRVGGTSSGGGGPWYMIGNIIYGIEFPVTDCNAYNIGGIGFRNTGSVEILYNTVYDVDAFVALALGSGATVTIRNNIFASKKAQCSAFENAGLTISNSNYNLFSQSSYVPSGAYYPLGSDSNSIIGDPKFVNPTTDFHLQPTSPAINSANPNEEAAFTVFKDRYGIDIRKDIEGKPRPMGKGKKWDIGAYEVVVPSAVTNLQIQ